MTTAVLPLLMGGCPPDIPAGGTTPGSCCAADGTCTVTAQADCATGLVWTAGGTCTPNPCTPAVIPITPQLYVANFTGNGVLSFLNPSTVNGNQAPSTNISGPQTSLNLPSDIAVTASGVLLAANFGAAPPSINVYPNASTANGNVVPARNVQGASTGLASPVTIAISTANDLLFVANTAGSFDINVFAGASTSGFLGNLPPARTIRSLGINTPRGINFGANDQLYVANGVGNTVVVFHNASTRNGTVAPDRTLTNAAFAGLFDCFVDEGDRLYVVNSMTGGNRVHVINSASTQNGAVTIDSTLTVTGATNLTAIAVDGNQTGYIVDSNAPGGGAIYAYNNINTRNGAFSPDRTIAGVATQLNVPIRVYLVE